MRAALEEPGRAFLMSKVPLSALDRAGRTSKRVVFALLHSLIAHPTFPTVTPPSVFFFFIALEPRVERYKSLRAFIPHTLPRGQRSERVVEGPGQRRSNARRARRARAHKVQALLEQKVTQ